MQSPEAKYITGSDEIEDGELTDSDECYTPLQRPSDQNQSRLTNVSTLANAGSSNTLNVSNTAELYDESDSSTDDESSSGSDDIKRLTGDMSGKRKKCKKKRATGSIRPVPNDNLMQSSRPKKYNIWCESLQEESLMEDMRGFDVAKDLKSDRSVENYDFSIKYRLNGENRLKRRRFEDTDEGINSDNDSYQSKRPRNNISRNVKSRLGWKASTSGSKDDVDTPRYIMDLDVTVDADPEEIARDIANKLYEEKDELLIRVVDVLGTKRAIEFFKETQCIEKKGGMMIMTGMRRRTPGGVFLFLIKTDMKISDENKKLIFFEEVKKSTNDRKFIQACRRDQKVEELKKRLNSKDNKIKTMSSCNVLAAPNTHLKKETELTLSNPPPSPVATGCQENSPDYSSHAINHVNDSSPEKVSAKRFNDLDDESLSAYEDDILDMNCDDMDLF